MELLFTGEFPPVKAGISNYVFSRCLYPPPDGLAIIAAESADCTSWDASSGLNVQRFEYRHGDTPLRRLEQIWRARRALHTAMRLRKYRAVTSNVLFPFGWIAASKSVRSYGAALFCHGAELLRARMSAVGRYVYEEVKSKTDLFIANSQMTADALLAHGCAAHRVCVIPPTVDLERFNPSVRGESMRRCWSGAGKFGPILLSVCRLDDVGKGVDKMIEVTARLRTYFPEVRYVVVGDGHLRPFYSALAKHFGVLEHVLFVGRISDDELPACYAACDVFVLLSRIVQETGYYEGFGIVYREAMACGKPTVVSREAGFHDYVSNGRDALVVSPRRSDEVESALRGLLEHPGIAAQMGACGSKCASIPSDWSPLNNFTRT